MDKELIVFLISITFSVNSEKIDSDRYNKSLAKSSWYLSSEQDPLAIVRNLLKSGFVRLPHPSAILVGMEVDDLLI